MRVSIPVLKANDDEIHWLSVEVDDDVATFYLDDEEICKTDFTNVEDLVTAIGLLWADWQRVPKKQEEVVKCNR